MSTFMKMRPVGAELFYANGRTDRQTDRWIDMTKLIFAFLNLWTRLKMMSGVYNEHKSTNLAFVVTAVAEIQW